MRTSATPIALYDDVITSRLNVAPTVLMFQSAPPFAVGAIVKLESSAFLRASCWSADSEVVEIWKVEPPFLDWTCWMTASV